MFGFVIAVPLESGDGQLTKKGKIILICILISFIIWVIILCNMSKSIENKSNNLHHVGEHQCIHCGSHDTRGYSTFWYDDGMLCNGSYEYNLTHADFTIIHCEYCGKNFRYYLQTHTSISSD